MADQQDDFEVSEGYPVHKPFDGGWVCNMCGSRGWPSAASRDHVCDPRKRLVVLQAQREQMVEAVSRWDRMIEDTEGEL